MPQLGNYWEMLWICSYVLKLIILAGTMTVWDISLYTMQHLVLLLVLLFIFLWSVLIWYMYPRSWRSIFESISVPDVIFELNSSGCNISTGDFCVVSKFKDVTLQPVDIICFQNDYPHPIRGITLINNTIIFQWVTHLPANIIDKVNSSSLVLHFYSCCCMDGYIDVWFWDGTIKYLSSERRNLVIYASLIVFPLLVLYITLLLLAKPFVWYWDGIISCSIEHGDVCILNSFPSHSSLNHTASFRWCSLIK